MAGNYPAGVTDGHPYFNPPDHSHDHDFYDVEGPIFEDGAAVFIAYCSYSEGRWGEGWSCEETRYWRCEVERVTVHRDDGPSVSYLASTERPNEEWRYVERLYEEALCGVERAFRDGEFDVVDVDPANEYGEGYVRVRLGNYEVIYEQDQ